MAKNTLSGEIIDPFNGLEDIKNKKIRILHDNSFIEDPSRIIRALKFSIRFGFELEENTRRLQNEYLGNINYDLSFHRLKKELKETFNLNKSEALTLFIEQKIYKLLGKNQIIPQIKHDTSELVEKYSPSLIYMVYLGLFDLSNFELTTEENDIINGYKKIKDQTPKNDIETYNLFSKVPIESVLIYAISVNTAIVTNYLDNLANIKIDINGNDLIALGFKQGRIFNEIFEHIRAEKIKNPSLTKEDEIKIVKEKFLC
jgi:poly(A) polymerase/tRNA nucleotidyltransferase (CCA-adding enzyme)